MGIIAEFCVAVGVFSFVASLATIMMCFHKINERNKFTPAVDVTWYVMTWLLAAAAVVVAFNVCCLINWRDPDLAGIKALACIAFDLAGVLGALEATSRLHVHVDMLQAAHTALRPNLGKRHN